MSKYDLEYYKEQITKNWKRRLPFLLSSLVVTYYLYRISGLICVVWLIIVILIDERIKEGYWIKSNEFFKFLTHENIVLYLIITLGLILVDKLFQKEGRD